MVCTDCVSSVFAFFYLYVVSTSYSSLIMMTSLLWMIRNCDFLPFSFFPVDFLCYLYKAVEGDAEVVLLPFIGVIM